MTTDLAQVSCFAKENSTAKYDFRAGTVSAEHAT